MSMNSYYKDRMVIKMEISIPGKTALHVHWKGFCTQGFIHMFHYRTLGTVEHVLFWTSPQSLGNLSGTGHDSLCYLVSCTSAHENYFWVSIQRAAICGVKRWTTYFRICWYPIISDKVCIHVVVLTRNYQIYLYHHVALCATKYWHVICFLRFVVVW